MIDSKKKSVMNFITRERVYRFSNECSESALAKFLYSYFPKRVVDSILASFEELTRGVAIKVIMQQSWFSKAKTEKSVT